MSDVTVVKQIYLEIHDEVRLSLCYNAAFWTQWCFILLFKSTCIAHCSFSHDYWHFVFSLFFCRYVEYYIDMSGYSLCRHKCRQTLCRPQHYKRRLASNADVGFYCVNIMTTSFSSPERIVWTIMSGIITVTRLMSSLGINHHWVKWIYLWFIHMLYAKNTRWNYMYIYFIAKKRKFLNVDRGIYFKSCVLKLTDITKQK